MPGFEHQSGAATDSKSDANQPVRNARVGLAFFAGYLAVYCGYVGLTAFAPSWMNATPIAGLNVATLYGLGLIVLAFVLALLYGWACRESAPRSDWRESAGAGR